MPFRVRHFVEDDKWCYHLSLTVLEQVYLRETVEQVRPIAAPGRSARKCSLWWPLSPR